MPLLLIAVASSPPFDSSTSPPSSCCKMIPQLFLWPASVTLLDTLAAAQRRRRARTRLAWCRPLVSSSALRVVMTPCTTVFGRELCPAFERWRGVAVAELAARSLVASAQPHAAKASLAESMRRWRHAHRRPTHRPLGRRHERRVVACRRQVLGEVVETPRHLPRAAVRSRLRRLERRARWSGVAAEDSESEVSHMMRRLRLADDGVADTSGMPAEPREPVSESR